MGSIEELAAMPFDQAASLSGVCDAGCPVLICLLGNFRLLKKGQSIALRPGGKTESLLCRLSTRYGPGIPRDTLLNLLWPSGDNLLSGQSLNSLVYSLNKLIGDALGGRPPVLHADGSYRLNVEAGIRVDVACFDALADAGDRHTRAGRPLAAAESYAAGVRLYRGDLCGGSDVQDVIERERLRARYLTMLAHLADYYFGRRDYMTCLEYTTRLLVNDPYREDAHRLAMRCYVRRGERGQALRQYRLCQDILRAEFGAAPEPATTALFEQIRLEPGRV